MWTAKDQQSVNCPVFANSLPLPTGFASLSRWVVLWCGNSNMSLTSISDWRVFFEIFKLNELTTTTNWDADEKLEAERWTHPKQHGFFQIRSLLEVLTEKFLLRSSYLEASLNEPHLTSSKPFGPKNACIRNDQKPKKLFWPTNSKAFKIWSLDSDVSDGQKQPDKDLQSLRLPTKNRPLAISPKMEF